MGLPQEDRSDVDGSAALTPERPAREEAAGRGSATVYRFLRETRAGATAIAAAAVTMMTLGGAALIVDHVWLVDQRDLLKSATDAAAIAATLKLQDLVGTMSAEEAGDALNPLAERYVRFNLAANLPEASRSKMENTLEVKVTVGESLDSIDVNAKADLGGTLLSKWLLAYSGPGKIPAHSGVEGSLGATEIVLAIDTTGSMNSSLDGSTQGGPTSRMAIVKKAAVDLVDVLESFPSSVVAVGIVPWTWRVRLNASTRSRWETDGWAVYPTERTYPHPTRGPPGSDRYLPETQPLPAQTRLPKACRAWLGCPDMRLEDGRPTFSTTHPSVEPFVMNYYTDRTTYPDDQYVSYQCQDYTRAESRGRGGEEPLCYDLDSAPSGQNLCSGGDIQADGPWRVHPQDDCQNSSTITPLNSNLTAVRRAIRGLSSGGSATYSSAGVAWGIRLLDASWRDAWGDSVHPMDQTTGVQKVLVLLTDGQDNSRRDAFRYRQAGCTAAKNAGIIVFTIAAMHPDDVGTSFAEELRTCSSATEDPDGTYVFVNNSTPEKLKEAFADIVRQMVQLRRTH